MKLKSKNSMNEMDSSSECPDSELSCSQCSCGVPRSKKEPDRRSRLHAEEERVSRGQAQLTPASSCLRAQLVAPPLPPLL